MPYVQVWVDDSDCGPCEECERREKEGEKDEGDVPLIMSEWLRAKQFDDYAAFGEFLESLRPSLWHITVYGLPTVFSPRPQGSS